MASDLDLTSPTALRAEADRIERERYVALVATLAPQNGFTLPQQRREKHAKTYRCSWDGKAHQWVGENGARVLCRNCDATGADLRGSMRNHVRRYLLRAYGVDTWKGRRVRYGADAGPANRGKTGVVVGHRSGYVLIQFDGEPRAGPHHVLWALEYLDDEGNVALDGRKRADEINEIHAARNARWAAERTKEVELPVIT